MELWRFKDKDFMHFVEQKYKTLIKTKWIRKSKIPNTVLERQTLFFSSCKNHKLKLKLRWVGAHKLKKRAVFVPFILSEVSFLNIYVLYQCMVYWIHFQNIHTFTYRKTFHTPLLVFKIAESLQCILNKRQYVNCDFIMKSKINFLFSCSK